MTRNWVFVHLPKTGGTFVRKVLRMHAPAHWEMRELHEHVQAKDTPESHRGLPHFGFVRHPLSWYVSWYHYFKKRPNKFFGAMSLDGTMPFDATLRRLFAHPAANGTVPGGIPGGPFTQYIQQFLGPGLSLAQAFRMETLRSDLLAHLERFDEVPAPLRQAIAEHEQVNESGHKGWRAHYDSELEAMVRERDRPVFEYFGYRD